MLWERAKEMMLASGYTCVLANGTDAVTSKLRGVKPLVQYLKSDQSFSGFSAADKVVGKATAFLYVLLGVEELFAQVISQPALEVLEAHGIAVHYGALVPAIINRSGDGICPFEAAVMEITAPQAAYEAILRKMREMNI